ncbi:cyanophycinase [Pseudalkalibacillus sp. Hm43]|uniref:cyanophycinase n=1 Tax=Pseudalkalibacillus sp. Hm43 TaxID=3450742 RepID=UPI003F4247D5
MNSHKKLVSSLVVALLLCAAIILPLMFQDGVQVSAGTTNEKGSLVIVGGALSPDNTEVYSAFIQKAQEHQNEDMSKIKIGILPTASSSPIQSATSYKKDFIHYGVAEQNIDIIPIAVRDDSSTEEDESTWKDNANDPELARQMQQYDAIWFVGGDQLRYTDTLLTEKKEDTPVLTAIRNLYQDGAVLGGTSAGAAIMSDPMIGAGTSLGALNEGATKRDNYDDSDDNRVFLTKGLGFFELGMVDQHFLERGRFGRIIVGAWEAGKAYGFGIEENSAMIVDNRKKTIQVVGESGLIIIDLADAKKGSKYPAQMQDVKLSYIEKGDQYHWDTKTFDIIKGKSLIENPYYPPNSTNTGIFEADALKQVMTYDLVDNEATEADALGFEMINENRGEGFKLTFREASETSGYWGKINGEESYAALNVMLDINPMKIKLKVKEARSKDLVPFGSDR